MSSNNFSQIAAFIWSVADLLRGDFRQSQYGRVILPFTLLRRLECVLAESKAAVVAEHERIQPLNLPEDAQEKFLLRVTNELAFFNTSPTRFYEFMSQIIAYDDKELEKLSLFSRNLRPMLRENIILDDEIDLSNVEMSHYRLSKLRQIDIELQANSTEHQLEPSNDVGSATAKDKKEDFLSSIIHRLNEVFVTDKLTDQDMVNYANTIADKVYENNGVMSQIANNTREQAMLGDFPRAIDDAILGSHEAHREQMMQLLSDPSKAHVFGHLIFDMLANRGQMPLR